MSTTNHPTTALRLFLLGDSIIHNEYYVGSAPSVTACLTELWPAGVRRIALDGDTLHHITEQYGQAVDEGFRPDTDVLVVSVMGNDLRVMLDVYTLPVETVAEGMITAYQRIQSVFAKYDAMVQMLRAHGVKNLVLVSIYPIYDMSLYVGDRMQFEVIDRPGAWVLMTPILGMVSRHIVDTGVRYGAQVADLFGGDFGPADIVNAIEPGASASPKVARIIAAAAERSVRRN